MLFGVFGIAAVMLLVLVVTGDGSLTDPFVLFWLFALGRNAYWWLLRVGRPCGRTAPVAT